MLDSDASWDEIAQRHADPEAAARLVDNEFFRTITRHFPASQSYAAAEKMADYLETNRWDVVIVDTPPSAGGIEFFTAPNELSDLIGGRLFRWITGGSLPGRREIYNLAARPALRVVDIALGSDLLERVTMFLFDLRTTYDGLRAPLRRDREAFPPIDHPRGDHGRTGTGHRGGQVLSGASRCRPAAGRGDLQRALPTAWEKAEVPEGTSRPLAREPHLVGSGGPPPGAGQRRVRGSLPDHRGQDRLASDGPNRSRRARVARRRRPCPDHQEPRAVVSAVGRISASRARRPEGSQDRESD